MQPLLEERGWVVQLLPEQVVVETTRRSTCSSCQLKSGCGQGLMNSVGEGKQQRMTLTLPEGMLLQVGDAVTLGILPQALLQVSLLMYILPLMGLFAGVLLGAELSWGEGWILLAGMLGLLVGFLLTRRVSRQCQQGQWQPVILDKVRSENGFTEVVEQVPIRIMEGKGR